MELLPEEPRSLTAQLRQMPAYQALLAPKPEPMSSTTSRIAAGMMQLKDTAAILLLLSDGSLLFGIFFGFGIPGLVLYGLRWRQVRGRTGRVSIIVQAVLSLLHELFWTCSFYSQRTASEPFNNHEVCTVLYGLGALLSLAQLLVAISGPSDEQYHTSLADEQ